jgi:hypothetical protein
VTTFIKRLDAAGIVNPHIFAERGDAQAFITFQRDHPHAFGYKQYQAHAWVRVGEGWGRKIFPASEGGSVPERRRLAVEKAQAWAGERLGGPEWVAGPFPDSWQTKETRERVTALLDEMRAS